MVRVRILGVVVLAIGTALGPFAGAQGAVESSSARRDALHAFDDVSATVAQLDTVHANMMVLDGKMSALYRALSAKVASVSKLAASSGTSSSDLMQATQQMQQMQMSFNLQYLALQEQMQNDAREYTALSNVLKARYDTMKGILANIK
jgi:hypothetical protein